MSSKPKIIFAGNRYIAVQILKYLISEGIKPAALILPTPGRGSNNQELIDLCGYLSSKQILFGDDFRQSQGIRMLSDLEPDYIICIHFPYLIPKDVLSIPTVGVLNLHPAYLPYNRGWHTPSWAILSDTPAGGTLHFMDEDIDTGDIVHQKEVEILPSDTADSLYKRIMEIEFEVFKEVFPNIMNNTFTRTSQKNLGGSIHSKDELLTEELRKLDLDKEILTGDLLKKLKALTTNKVNESAFFEVNGIKYFMQVKITKEEKYEE